ncbi:hypothetical protein OsJ_03756 [Oryza sativa Japonica Group]|uniref:Uncharacterized protein n=1 Tax=Oryza sativa subsp. japonica TaxID=39947 RepID=B9ETQ9_ORYSJ|nr:hypothetical protein OsJ_03756 [Oryza sativa Japonica Group]
MSQTPDADPGRDTFTCGTLFMCLNLRGLFKKKPEEVGKSRRQSQEQDQDQAAAVDAETEQEPQYVPAPAPIRAASFEKLERSPPYSGSNIAFDLLVEPELGEDRGARQVLAYCPSPCFDLPAGLMMRAGERCDAPGTAGFVLDGCPTKGAPEKSGVVLRPTSRATTARRGRRISSGSCRRRVLPHQRTAGSREARDFLLVRHDLHETHVQVAKLVHMGWVYACLWAFHTSPKGKRKSFS